MKAVIALGANLGEPRSQVLSAIEEIKKLLNVNKVSSLYETAPFGVPDSQPNYINAVLTGETDHKPLDLMKALLEVENALGRTRSFQNAARLIDIDIIDLGGLFLESEPLTLPHPRAHERRFVLEPWFEIDPEAHLPGRGPISALLAALN
ncbi:MAG: 2-amino-4-hydroxy-6-hydroxymethyldihydropteridine diphosphokinase [Candidatus Nanopelagicaceae bacterium]|nr:2-amino-4-hydroxy-6-hydroxymethyldihydropteridine diphosphokinase [Candidatus Nanopelagicaceae bacterium]